MVEHKPKPRYYLEKIGAMEYKLEEAQLDGFNDVTLWSENPRLLPSMADAETLPTSEAELEELLQNTPGYDGLRKSIEDVGQMEPIYVWKKEGMQRYLVLEGATRVTILRELSRKKAGQPQETIYRRVRVKILPEEFDERQRAILLARIHVRGSSVRSWGRYIEAKFIYDNVAEVNGQRPLMSITEMAGYMGKSVSWVSRLRDAYEFASQFVDHVDSPDAKKQAVRYFSILEEISKSTGFGKLLRGDDKEAEKLRGEVFDMVSNGVFTEYRDARSMQKYFEDEEKWERLKSHEPGAANQLANEIKAGSTSIKGKLDGITKQIERSLDRQPDLLDVDDWERLQEVADTLASHVAADLGVFRLRMKGFTDAVFNASLDDVKKVTPEEYERLKEGLEDFEARLNRHAPWRNGNLQQA